MSTQIDYDAINKALEEINEVSLSDSSVRKSTTLAETFSNPEVRERLSAGNKSAQIRYLENPENKKKKIDHMKKIRDCKLRVEKVQQANRVKNNTPKMLTLLKENAKKRRRPFMTPDGAFNTRKEAADYFGFDTAMVSYWLKKNPKEWYHITQEEYDALPNA